MFYFTCDRSFNPSERRLGAWTARHERHRLADVALAAAGSIDRGGRPQREVVGERRQRAHVHQVVPQQAVASTQSAVDLRQEEVSAVHSRPQ